jgi:tetratricopeptide (TPR) repeat protein
MHAIRLHSIVKNLFVVFALFFSISSVAQSTDEQLAAQFYETGEYQQAVDIYKKLFRKSSSSIYIYENYLNSLIALNEEKDAENLVEKQIKNNQNGFNYLVDLAYVYVQFKNTDKANAYLDDLIRDFADDRNAVNTLAQAMIRRQLTDKAITLYETAGKKQTILAFFGPLMNLYRQKGEYQKMIDLGLNVINIEAAAYDQVLRYLDVVYEKEEWSTYLQSQTLLYSQKNPNKTVFDELLLEVYLQQKKYNAAVKQAIAMDKRNNEQGYRLLNMANLCIKNQEYDAAIKSYEYVRSLGKTGEFYQEGERGFINVLYLKTTSNFVTNQEDVKLLMDQISVFITENGESYNTANSMYQLAELNLFYANNVAKGVEILERIVIMPRLQSSFIAKAKLLLGDAYLIQNNIWDAKLMYGQVDKEFKEDALGQEAKFKNAKLSYYTGDFEWAKGQLDILKTATTQLISNNAIELALLIQDNTGLDSTEDAMKEYAQAEFYLYQNNIAKCSEILNMLPFKYPKHTLNDDIYFLKAKLQEKSGNYIQANELYEKVYTNYSRDILADNALFRSASIYLYVLNQPEKAQSLFEKLVLDYNSSLFAVDARKLYYGLKEGKTKEELFFEGVYN